MGTCDCAVVQERVIVPEAVTVKEQIVVPDTVTVKATVSVPAIVQKPRWIPDIEWGDLEECPKDSVWFVVTDELPSAIGRPHVQFSSFYDQYFIDWGDGESYASPMRTNTLDFINHTYAKGTGNIDSKGREFWIMKAKFSNPAQSDIAPNGYVYVKVGVKLAWNISPIKYVVVGEDIDPDYNFEFNQGWDHLEAIRFKGKDRSIRDFPSFSYGRTPLRHILTDGTLKIRKLSGYRFRNIIAENMDNIEVLGGTIGEYIWGNDNMAFGKADLSKMTFGNLSHCFYGIGRSVEEVILPQVEYTGNDMTNCFNNCRNLKRIVFPPKMDYIEKANGAFVGCYSLYDFEFPEGFATKGNGLRIQMSGFNKTFSLDWPDVKLDWFVYNGIVAEGNVGLQNLIFSKESKFSYSTATNLEITNSPLGHDNIVSILDRLPDFTGMSPKTIKLTGCVGVSELTDDEKKIATDKNWILTV